jgi:arabinofuranosyltransferase
MLPVALPESSMVRARPSLPSLRSLLVPAGCFAFFAIVMLRSAWLSDDGLITFRTIDNFVNGHGLRFNLAERVQSYTHPLWLLVLSPVYFITREAFYTPIVFSMLCSGAAVLIALTGSGARAMPVAVVACLVSSKAFVDYTTSGLENPLSFLLIAVWIRLYLERVGRDSREGETALLAVASLMFVNRMDSLLLVLPALLAGVLHVARSGQGIRSLLRPLFLGTLPATAWLGFSIVYYGSFVANTAWAKLGTGIDPWALRVQGLFYLGHALRLDPVTPLLIGLALAGVALDARARRHWRLAPLALGLLLQLLYVIEIGGDFMMGRFLAVPFFLSVLVLKELPAPAWSRAAVGTLCISLSLSSPLSPLRSGPDYENRDEQQVQRNRGIADERGFYYLNGGLLSPHRHSGLRAESACRDEGPTVLIRGVCGQLGYEGYTACSDAFLTDRCALTDPLLARMPMIDTNQWRVGHYFRRVPRGYRESLESDANQIAYPGIRTLYDDIRIVTRAPLFASGRLSAILRLNTRDYPVRR